MSCLAGRVRPLPVFNADARFKHEQRTSSTDPSVSKDSGFYLSGPISVNTTILSSAKPTLGHRGCTHTGNPRGTCYQERNYRYCKFVRKTPKLPENDPGNKKSRNKNSIICFPNFRRSFWDFIFRCRWVAFFAIFVFLETKTGMTPRVAAFTFDGPQASVFSPNKETIYRQEEDSKPNETVLTWRSSAFLTKKVYPSTMGLIAASTRRAMDRRPKGKIRRLTNATRLYEYPRERNVQYPKKHYQHYNYYHPHYHRNNEHHRAGHHKQDNLHDPEEGPLYFEKTEEGRGYGNRRSRRSADTDDELDPLERLSRVFGIRRIPFQGEPFPNQIPPEYMTRLYRTVTDSGGLTKANGPYNADIVRSFPDRDYRHQMHFFYNVSFLEAKENILQAEFHLFKLRPKNPQMRKTDNPHLISIEIHQVTSLKDVYNPDNLKLIDMRRVSAYSHGWITFTVLKAVISWVNSTSPNYGFLVKSTSLSGESLNGSSVRFAQRKEHHDTKQPILVVFTDDGLQKHRNFISPKDEGYQEIKQDILRHEQLRKEERDPNLRQAIRLLNERERSLFQQHNHGSSYWSQGSKRKRRSARNPNGNRGGGNSTSGAFHERNRRTLFRRKRRNCARYEMYVDFNAIGWSGWIISPKGYNAYHCSGPCPFPLGQSHRPTNHATVQSIVHALRAGKNVMTPCCVPDKLYSISLLYFDDHENVILKLYEDMVAASCGCH